MVATTPPPRVGLRQGRRTLPAIPVHLRGDEVSLVLADVPAEQEDVRLVLHWACGSVTELTVEVRSIEEPRRLAHLHVRSVDGDWAPFLAYLGEQTG